MIITEILKDTLKRKDADGQLKWSASRFTQFTATISFFWGFHYALIKYGINTELFWIVALLVSGVRLADAWSKKLNPEKPNEESK